MARNDVMARYIYNISDKKTCLHSFDHLQKHLRFPVMKLMLSSKSLMLVSASNLYWDCGAEW